MTSRISDNPDVAAGSEPPVVPTPGQARNGWTAETLSAYVAERRRAGAERIAAAARRRPAPTRAETDYDIQGW